MKYNKFAAVFSVFFRYLGFDKGDRIYDGAAAAKHLGREFIASAKEVGKKTGLLM